MFARSFASRYRRHHLNKVLVSAALSATIICASSHVAFGLGQVAQTPGNVSAITTAQWQWPAGDQDSLWVRWTANADTQNQPQAFTGAGWSQRAYTGHDLPLNVFGAQLVADDAPISIDVLQTVPATPPARVQVAGELQPPATTALPNSPVFVLRTGTTQGMRLAVLAFSPFIQVNGEWQFVTSLTARVSGVVPTVDGALDDGTGMRTASSTTASAPVAPPKNPSQPDSMWRIVVARAGIQSLTGAALANAGIDLSTADANRLRLQFDGADIATQLIDYNNNGRLDAQDELRFYARAPGDRWNQTDTYWLTLASTATRMQVRITSTDGSPARNTANASGTWSPDSVYDSLLPGADADHWFAAQLNDSKDTASASLASELPFAAGTMLITATGSTTQPGQSASLKLTLAVQTNDPSANMAVTSANEIEAEAAFDNNASADWMRRFGVNTSPNSQIQAVQVSASGAAVQLEDIEWQAPVTLSFGGRGAAFSGVDGNWTYQLSGLGPDAIVYDVSDWMRPVVVPLTVSPNGVSAFSDGPSAHDYVIADSNTVLAPAIAQRATADLGVALNARGIYIAPASMHAALAPLLQHRRTNGWLVTVVDTQAIYDTWSFGQVSPSAIRSFLRYAASTWRVSPLYVVMVGDGNYDPLNHSGSAAPTLVPPYLANVDPWVGETACESCYVQLDGDDPLSDSVPDMYFGRLPVKNAAELATVVNKIIGYETAPVASWMWRNVFVADNFQEADGAKDEAGNFSGFEDASLSLQPLGVETQRAYYDPFAPTANGIWRVADAGKVRERTLDLWNAGAAIMNYSGHGLNGQWAYLTAHTPSLMTTADAAMLTNGNRLPFVLSWACLTGSFHLPESSGTSIDEQLVLAPNGGAIGTWSSTGLGVMYSHEFLRRGFYKALWSAPAGSLTLGVLTRASLMDLFQNAACCDEPLRTYNLLGDPMTPLRVALPSNRTWIPTVSR